MQEILSNTILANLYGNSLVIVEDNEKAENLVQKEVKPVMTEVKHSPIKTSALATTTIHPTVSAPTVIVPSEKWFLGDNGKKITILVNEANVVYLNEESLQFLTKIITACKLNMGDVAVVNLLNKPMTFAEIHANLQSKFCLLFDVTTENIQLPFSIPHYQVQQYNGCQFLLAPTLNAYYGDGDIAKTEKTKLWTSLKKIFNL